MVLKLVGSRHYSRWRDQAPYKIGFEIKIPVASGWKDKVAALNRSRQVEIGFSVE